MSSSAPRRAAGAACSSRAITRFSCHSSCGASSAASMRSRSVLLCLVLACGCSHRQTGFQPLAVAGTTAEAEALVRAALVLDAAADRQADTLYSPDAVVFANARQRFAHPRFAGVSYGGRVTVAASAVNMMGSWAWAVVDYRWIGGQRS